MKLVLTALSLSCLLLVGCGSRSRLFPAESRCESDDQCDRSNLCAAEVCEEGVCVTAPPVVCTPQDSCFEAACEPTTGECVETPLTPDEDQDGFRAPRPGFDPSDPEACGNDCDDASALARPGGEEVCDGTDNDCDGIVDNGSRLLPLFDEITAPLRVASSSVDRSSAQGIAFGAGYFALHYWGHVRAQDKIRPLWRALSPEGIEVFPEDRLTQVNAPSWGASVAWSGSAFGAAWSDGRIAQNYEIYFTLFDPKGEKRIADLQLTSAEGMSLDPIVLYDQGRFNVIWADRRNGPTQLFLQMLNFAGKPIGGNVQLTPDIGSIEIDFPSAAATPRSFGLVYVVGTEDQAALEFRTYEKQYFSEISPPLPLTLPSSSMPRVPNVVALGDRFLVTWHTEELGSGGFPGPSIWGAIVDENGGLIRGPEAIAGSGTFARGSSLVSFGDRALVGYSDTLAGKADIYGVVVDADLYVRESPVQLTTSPRDTRDPRLARGDGGRIGMLYNDLREGPQNAYFVSFGCGSTLLE
jgi:Putative metal-binding motif